MEQAADSLTDDQIVELEAKLNAAADDWHRYLCAKVVQFIDEKVAGCDACETEIVDAGYDMSEYPKRIFDETFEPTDDMTVGDILGYPTGNTVATYMSGEGIMCEYWDDEAFRETDVWFDAWYRSKSFPLDKHGDVPEEVSEFDICRDRSGFPDDQTTLGELRAKYEALAK